MTILVTQAILSPVTFGVSGASGGVWYEGGRTLSVAPESVTKWGTLHNYGTFVTRRVVHVNESSPLIVAPMADQDEDVRASLARVYRRFRVDQSSDGCTSREVPQVIRYAMPIPKFSDLWYGLYEHR